MNLTDKTFVTFVCFLVFLVAYLWITAIHAMAQNEVKYCKDARTGEIIVVPADRPCPYPTHEV